MGVILRTATAEIKRGPARELRGNGGRLPRSCLDTCAGAGDFEGKARAGVLRRFDPVERGSASEWMFAVRSECSRWLAAHTSRKRRAACGDMYEQYFMKAN